MYLHLPKEIAIKMTFSELGNFEDDVLSLIMFKSSMGKQVTLQYIRDINWNGQILIIWILNFISELFRIVYIYQ